MTPTLTTDRASPLIDVLIPVFNGEATIESSIASIQRQSVRDIRIIVVDDGSTDATPLLLRHLASKDPRIHVMTQPNRGIVEALNAGLAASRAEFLARHDADDIAFPNRLARQTAYLRDHADCVAVGCSSYHIDAKGRRTGTQARFGGDVRPDPYAVPSIEPYLPHPFLTARRAAIMEVGGYRPFVHSEDTDLYWRLLPFGRLHNLPQVLGEYRLHDASVSSASIVNGRIAAVNSQLAAVSYKRRRQGLEDIVLPANARDAYTSARSLQEILALAGRGLGIEEIEYLEVASAAKLLTLVTYRPYIPDLDDCLLLAAILRRHEAFISTATALHLDRIIGQVAIRLLRRGLWREALALQSGPNLLVRASAARLYRKAQFFLQEEEGKQKTLY